MRILFVIDSLTLGGAERVVVNLANYFNRNGHECGIIIFRNVNYFKNELKNISIYTVNKKNRFDFTILFKIKKIIKNFKPDIINTHLFTASFWTKLATFFDKTPLFEVHHNVLWNEKWYTQFHKLANKITNFRVKKHIFVSKDVRDFYSKVEKIDGIIIYNGIKVEKFSFHLNRNKYNLLFVGRLIERKGIRDLLNIEKQLPEKYSLTICGLGPMEDYVVKNKLKKTIFLKGCEATDVLKKVGLLLMPSYWEGFSITVLEALASGVPIITYKIKGNINNPLKNYFIMVEKGNIQKFLKEILNFRYDYDKIKAAHLEIHKNYSVEQMGKNYLELFKNDN